MKKGLSYIAYALSYTFWYTMSLLPMSLLYVFSDCLYLLVGKVVKYRHKVIWKNLKDSFPEKDEAELQRIERGFYHYFCDYLVETIKLLNMSKRELRQRMVFTGIEEMNELLEKGVSCAVYLGHYGNWELITSLPLWVSEKAQCCQVYHPLNNERFDKLFKSVREKHHALCIPMAETLRQVVSYRQKKQPIVIGYIADQAPFWNNIHHWVDFLNHDTPVLTGSERIIKKTGQAVFYGDVSRVRRGYYQCDFKLITTEPAKYMDWEITDKYFQLLEETIRRQPELYLWSHKRWKRTREEFNLRYDEKTGRVSLEPLDEIIRKKDKE
ncbi:lysophospholipid acyltransferase family protein [Prevotella melaninogenica]